MFKSIFAKSFAAIALILVISFSAMILMVSMIIGESEKKAQSESMYNTAYSIENDLPQQMKIKETDDLGDFLQKNEETVRARIRSFCHRQEITVIITDLQGNVLYASGWYTMFPTKASIDPSIMDNKPEKYGVYQFKENEGVYDFSHAMIRRDITYIYEMSDRKQIGYLYVIDSDDASTTETVDLTKAIISSILWILLAALIAAYVVIERLLSPLRAIRDAAKSCAEGNFDVHLPVRGKDEIAEISLAFNSMAETMNNYDTMRNTFLSNVSHELRTPMTSIAGFIDGILDGVIPVDKHPYYLKLVSEEIKRLSRLVATLLDLSRIQAGDRKFTMASFDICEMSRQILISFEQKINDKRLNVEFDCDEENIHVIADRDAIHQVFYNLCDNAVKFASEGGCFRISIQKIKNRKILISVFNEGQGISEADLPYVFERFYKSDKSRGLNKSGIGLGLFIAKTIADAHHEKLWVESEFGKSCCFKFTLSGE